MTNITNYREKLSTSNGLNKQVNSSPFANITYHTIAPCDQDHLDCHETSLKTVFISQMVEKHLKHYTKGLIKNKNKRTMV